MGLAPNRAIFPVAASAFLMGLAAAAGQIQVLRELLVLFYGNELSAGLILACWLLCTAAGSGAAGRFRHKGAISAKTLLFGFCLLSLALPLTIAWIRAARFVWSVPPGSMISPGSMILIALSSTAPFCILSGAAFAIAWNLASDLSVQDENGAMPVYLAEAAGSGAGGIIFYFVLLPHFPALQGCILLCFLLLSAAAVVLIGRTAPGRIAAFVVILVLLLGAVFYGYSEELDQRTRLLQWGKNFVASRDTPYQNLALLQNADQFTLFSNGLWTHSVPDPQTAEQTAQLPLLEHPSPKKVLAIGDFSPEVLAQLENNVGLERIDCVRPDWEFVAFEAEALPAAFTKSLTDPRLHLIYMDPNRFSMTASRDYDVIILRVGEPVNAATNRFYTVEFFTRIKGLLAPGGLLSFTAPAAPNIVGPREAALLQSLHRTLKAVFPSVLVFSGDAAYFFASDGSYPLTSDPDVLSSRIAERGLDLHYIRDFYLADCLNPFRLAYLDSVLDGTGNSGINRDFEPVCYLYALGFWGAQVHPALGRLFAYLSGAERNLQLAGFFLIFFALPLLLRTGLGSNAAVVFNSGVCGAALILLEIILILVFQVLSGSMYEQLALIISVVMAGLAAGGALGRKAESRGTNALRGLFFVQTGFAALAGSILVMLTLFEKFPAAGPGAGPVLIVSLILACMAGMLGGMQFSLAVSATTKNPGNRSAGTLLYAADLTGAALGAISGSLFLIPVLGIPRTLLVLTAGCLASSLALLRRSKGSRF